MYFTVTIRNRTYGTSTPTIYHVVLVQHLRRGDTKWPKWLQKRVGNPVHRRRQRLHLHLLHVLRRQPRPPTLARGRRTGWGGAGGGGGVCLIYSRTTRNGLWMRLIGLPIVRMNSLFSFDSSSQFVGLFSFNHCFALSNPPDFNCSMNFFLYQ